MENIEKKLGSVVKSLRLAAGMTQENLAQRLTDAGLPTKQNTVAKLEGGLRPTTVPELGALARVFNLSVPELAEAVFALPEDEEANAALRAELMNAAAMIARLDAATAAARHRLHAMEAEKAQAMAMHAELARRLGS